MGLGGLGGVKSCWLQACSKENTEVVAPNPNPSRWVLLRKVEFKYCYL